MAGRDLMRPPRDTSNYRMRAPVFQELSKTGGISGFQTKFNTLKLLFCEKNATVLCSGWDRLQTQPEERSDGAPKHYTLERHHTAAELRFTVSGNVAGIGTVLCPFPATWDSGLQGSTPMVLFGGSSSRQRPGADSRRVHCTSDFRQVTWTQAIKLAASGAHPVRLDRDQGEQRGPQVR